MGISQHIISVGTSVVATTPGEILSTPPMKANNLDSFATSAVTFDVEVRCATNLNLLGVKQIMRANGKKRFCLIAI